MVPRLFQRLLILVFPGILVSVAGVHCHADEATDSPALAAVQKALPYLQREGVAWMEKRQCVSCHQIPSMLWSLNGARQQGLPLAPVKLKEWTAWSVEKMRAIVTEGKRPAPVDNLAQLILGLAYAGDASTDPGWRTDLAAWLAAQQEPDGRWKAAGQLPRQDRPELETDAVSTTWVMLALENVGGFEASRAAAGQWLEKSAPGESTEWWAVRWLQAARQNPDSKSARTYSRGLLARQNADGGWPWKQGGVSDPLATGICLVVLSNLKFEDQSAARTRAVNFLVGKQNGDGNWKTFSTKKGQGGKVTEVSTYWGTAWAVAGLTASLEP